VARPHFALYSQHGSAEIALSALQKLAPNLEVEEEKGVWRRAHVSWSRSLWRSPLKLTINHSLDYYTGERWPTQLMAMQTYLQRFHGAKERADVFTYLAGLRFALSFNIQPAPVKNDPRRDVIMGLARELKAVVFSPTALLDAQGRAILSDDGPCDASAVVPECVAGNAWASPDRRPSPMRVAQRLLVMAALTERGLLDVSDEPTSIREDRRTELIQLLHAVDAWNECTVEEQHSLEIPIGQLEADHAWHMTWLAEGVMVLGWALGRCELPAYDEEADLGLLWHLAGLTKDGQNAAQLVAMATLRDEAAIKLYSEQILAIHWRLRQFEQDKQARNLEAFAAKAWTGSLDLGMARVIEGDLAIDDLPLCQVDDSRREVVAAVVTERHKMMRWLMGLPTSKK
jgi:hypothetical protein